jgi:hypothetical protein
MKKWFCTSENGLDPAVKTAAYMAGYLVAKNNPVFAGSALPVAKGIQATVNGGGDNGALNAVLREAVTELAGKVSDDAVAKAAVLGVLSSLDIDIAAGSFPALENEKIKGLVDSFVAGMTASVTALS